MRQLILIFILIVSTTFTVCGQSDSNKAKLNAQTDFEEGNYFFHSLEFSSLPHHCIIWGSKKEINFLQ